MTAPRKTRGPVYRPHGHRYLLVVLVAFASTVVSTRWFLEIAGYPKLAGGELHVAHALWGGLLLYSAALLPLVLVGRTAYLVAALGTGAGMGLFIDEVGKLITERNDYFYPAAAPLIYALFLTSVLAWLHIRRRRPNDARSRLISAMEGVEDAVGRDLMRTERREVLAEVERARAYAETEPERQLASAMHSYLVDGTSPAVKRRGPWDAVRVRWLRRRRRWVGGRGARAVVGAALLLAGLNALVILVLTSIAMAHGLRPEDAPPLFWRLSHLLAEALAGAMLLAGAVLVLSGRRDSGLRLASVGLIVALAIADLLAFYLRQFESVFTALFHLSLLLVVSMWRTPWGSTPHAGARRQPRVGSSHVGFATGG